MAAPKDLSAHIIPMNTPLHYLFCENSFLKLSWKEKMYCHFFGRAAWEGALICLLQKSPESAPIFLLMKEIFRQQSPSSLRLDVTGKGQVSKEEFRAVMMYAAGVFTNMGNYKSFGDTKFIPDIDKEKMEIIVHASKLCKWEPDLAKRLWNGCSDAMYSLEPRERQLGLGEEGVTTYYSANCTKEDVELIQTFLIAKGVEAYNTRVFKTEGQDGEVKYELRFASILTSADPLDSNDTVAPLMGDHTHNSTHITVTRGDYGPILENVVKNLQRAKEFAGNSTEEAMLDCYIHSFQTGSLEQHKQASRHWIKNKQPGVETYIGFVESYRDPYGVRGEFEGLVAAVNKSHSAKLKRLVDHAEQLLSELPWPKSFERDNFLTPDFACLDVISYAGTVAPLGVNLPNYDEIRQNEGFKNVALANVMTASSEDKRVNFLRKEDEEVYIYNRGAAIEMQVGLRELLGHGSGKIFRRDENGVYNFDPNDTRNPLTDKEITSWYNPGETWDTKFSSIATPYEECRSECVGLYLSLNRDVLSIFGHRSRQEGSDVMYVNWLHMIMSGVLALEYYNPDTEKWGQARMQARYVIVLYLWKNGGDLVRVLRLPGETKDETILQITLDRRFFEREGKRIIHDLLLKLQVYKSTGDVAAGRAFFEKCSIVEGEWLNIRNAMLKGKLPRRMLIQPLTNMNHEEHVSLRHYDTTLEGLLSHYTECYDSYDNSLLEVWTQNQHFWKN